MKLCFYGASSRTIDPFYKEEVEKLARCCARRGHSLVFGGGKEGCMGAAARGFRAEGGKVLGIAPRFFNADGVLDPDCTEMIFTDTMRERKQLLETRSDAFVVMPGGVGTFDEFFEILCLKQIGRHEKPIALFNPGAFYDPLLAFLKSVAEKNFMSQTVNEELYRAFSEPEALCLYLETYRPASYSLEELKDVGEENGKR